jgi:FMN reductase
MEDKQDQSGSVRITGISGSRRAGSYTRMAVEAALIGATESGAKVELLDLRAYDLPFADGTDSTTPDLERLRASVKQADGVILGTPEYHGSVSGVLKNALDLMGFEEFEGKMVGLVGVSGGVLGAFNALNELRNIGRVLHAWVVPEQTAVAEAWKVFDKSGAVKDEKIAKRLTDVGRSVARFARLHKCAAAQEFLKHWEESTPNPGG